MNIVAAMARRDPEMLAELRSRHQGQAAVFRGGLDMGSDDTISIQAKAKQMSADMERVLAQLALVHAGLPSLRADCDAVLERLATRLRMARRLQLTGALISAAASAGLIPTIGATPGNSAIGVGLATVAFLSSVLSLLAEQLTGKSSGGDVAGLFENAVKISAQLLAVERGISRVDAIEPSKQLVEDLENQADLIAHDVHSMMKRLQIL